MSERETRELTSVEAFSQLPFIRPPPAREKVIRLFGIEVDREIPPDNSSSSSSSSKDNNNNNNNSGGRDRKAEEVRKFECHYCCRNFSTSQALGGHQNAHKRERQNAKRAHLHSALAAAGHRSTGLGDAHMYGLVNYHQHRFRAGHGFESNYPPWGTTAGINLPSVPRFYEGPGSVTQPINGNPLPGMWRVPPGESPGIIGVHRERSVALPLFAGNGSTDLKSPTSPKSRVGKEHLSLDLHL